jgi:hypothetical protein
MDELSTSEVAALVALMAEAREVSNTELATGYGFTLTGPERTRLNQRRLVTSRRVGRAFSHELTDLGWARCVALLGSDVPPRAGAAAGALYAVLAGVRRYLDRESLTLSDVFRGADAVSVSLPAPRGVPVPRAGRTPKNAPARPSDPAVKSASDSRGDPGGRSAKAPSGDVATRIYSAYASLATRAGDEVALSELRSHLRASNPDTSSDDIDATLRMMALTTRLSLLPEDKRSTLRDRDREAALVVGGQSYHYVTIADA